MFSSSDIFTGYHLHIVAPLTVAVLLLCHFAQVLRNEEVVACERHEPDMSLTLLLLIWVVVYVYEFSNLQSATSVPSTSVHRFKNTHKISTHIFPVSWSRPFHDLDNLCCDT